MSKPKHISMYLVLKDLLNGIDVRSKSDVEFYLTGRIENIKNQLKNQGLLFDEYAQKISRYGTPYKPYLLINTKENLEKAKKLLELYSTNDVVEFANKRMRY